MSWLTTSHHVSAVTEHYPMAPPGSPAMTSQDIGEAYRLPGSLWHIATLVFILFGLLSDLFGKDTGVITPAAGDAKDC